MTCAPCRVVGALALNLLLASDLLLNTLTGGYPRETVSRRVARARNAGERWAARFCAVLTWIGRRFGSTADHCTYALDDDAGSIGSEVLHLSPVETIHAGK
jgi:hypothetical protein